MNSSLPRAVDDLVALSNFYGSRVDYVIAGGGNTSWKDEGTLWVKGSGQALGSIGPGGFAKMDRRALAALWTQEFSADPAQREKEVLVALMAARLPGEEAKRPSVETLLHDMMPFPFVVHTHPTLVNALTCAQKGQEAFDRLFAAEAVWIPLVDPGYVLSKVVRDALGAFRRDRGRDARIVFMQNHGIVVAGESVAKIRSVYDRVLATLEAEISTFADLTPWGVDVDAEQSFLATLGPARAALGSEALFCTRSTARAVLDLAASDAAFVPLSSAFTPDHIVYMGVSPVRIDGPGLPQALANYAARYGKAPRVILVKDLGAFCLGPNAKAAGQALMLLLDAVKIARASQAFGGPRFMTTKAIDFIRNWEVEAFRSQVSSR